MIQIKHVLLPPLICKWLEVSVQTIFFDLQQRYLWINLAMQLAWELVKTY